MLELFYPVVGAWNLVGSLLIIACVHEPLANKIFHQWTYIFAHPYEHGKYGHIFILWVGGLNACLGAFMILAPGWDPAARAAVVISANIGYATFLVLGILGLRSPNYGPGIPITIALWALLLAWGLAVLWQGV